MFLNLQDAAQLFLRRCRRPLYPRDFEAESASLEGAMFETGRGGLVLLQVLVGDIGGKLDQRV